MRIHELLEASIDYIAVEGILGCDPFALQRHLSTLDSSINPSGFSYTWKLLVQHPSIQVILTTYPLLPEDGEVILGSEPLPADYEAPEASKSAVDYDTLFREGLRGRQIAYHLAGTEFRTSRQAVEDKRKEKAKSNEEKRKRKHDYFDAPGPSGTTGADEDGQLLRVLEDDDGGPVEDAVDVEDLTGLMNKWGSRLRIRCTDQEIYFRLTGSHQRIPKISAVVLHILQLAARSREHGMTAVDLGPLVGASQGSMHYYMKVLIGLGLCAKVPVIQHASSTNILVFHKYLHLNANYRALQGANNAEALTKREEETPLQDVEDQGQSYAIGTNELISEMGLAFPPLTEPELMSGFVVRERLVKLLDHPGLANHMLRVLNLLHLLGWQGTGSTLRHRRAVLRVVNAMVEEQMIERLDVGDQRIRCIRLTKYNRDFVPNAEVATEEETMEDFDREPLALDDLEAFDTPFTYTEGIPVNLPVEHLICKVIVDSGHYGVTFADIREKIGNLYKRSVDAIIARVEEEWLPLNLRPLAVCTVMESEGKERRIRCFGTTSYREYITSQGHQPDDDKHPPEPPESGHWANLWFRDFYDSPDDMKHWIDSYNPNYDDPVDYKPGHRALSDRPAGRPRKTAPPTVAKRKRDGYMSMTNTVQVRGRPRKYVHVVDDQGKPNRNVIGVLLPHPEVPPVLVWLKDQDLIIPAPNGYSGVGIPPKPTAELLALGKPPSFFSKYPKAQKSGVKNPGVGKGNGARKEKGKGKGKAGDEDEEEDELDSEKQSSAAKPKKKKAKVATTSSTPVETPAATPTTAKMQSFGLPPPGLGSPGIESGPSAKRQRGEAYMPPPEVSAPPINAELAQHIDPRISTPTISDPPPSAPIAPMTAALPGAWMQPAPPPPGSIPKKRGRPRKDAAQPSMPVAPSSMPQTATMSTPAVAPPAFTPAPPARKQPEQQRTLGGSSATTSATSPEVTFSAPPVQPSLFLQSPATSPQDSTFPHRGTDTKENVPPPFKRVPSATPLRDIGHNRPMPPPPTVSNAHAPKVPRGGRIDLGLIRKVKELCQVLGESGGVLSELKLYHEHAEWAKRVAGTDAPSAPTVAYMMDRNVYHKTCAQAVQEGRLKQTKTSIPTTTGRWVQTAVLYLPDAPQEVVQGYIRNLAMVTADSMKAPRRAPGVAIPQTSFTEIRRDAATLTAIRESRPGAIPDAEVALTRRETLFKEPYTAAYLLGFQSGRWLRMQILHRAIVESMAKNPLSVSNVSKSPRVFSITFLFEDISIKDWFACLDMMHWHPDLEVWLKDPEKSKMRIADLPESMRPRWGLRGHKSKNKLVALISVMCELKILTPLSEAALGAEDELVRVAHPSGGAEMAFRRADNSQAALFYLVHDYAPVYHCAWELTALLGVLPVKTIEETDAFWSAEKRACLSRDRQDLSAVSIQPIPPMPLAAPIPPRLELDGSLLNLLRSEARWEHHVRLVPAQSEALREAIDWTTGQRLYTTPEQVADLAWQNGLSPEYVETWLATKSLKATQKLSDRREQHRAEALKFKARQDKSRQLLREKLASRREEAKKAWEERVRRAAAAAEYDYSIELSDFVRKQTLLAAGGIPVDDESLKRSVALYKRSKELGEMPRVPGKMKAFPAPPRLKRKPIARKPPTGNFPVQIVHPPDGRRRRINWTPENDELFMDAEAIIRCRCGTRQNLGRTAMLQIFPNASASILLHKIKKVMAVPSREAYLEALQNKFQELWLQYRGTPELPDENFDDHVNFDLVAHINFLREKIDKRAIRASIKTQGRGQKIDGPAPPPLPTTIEELLAACTIEDVDTQTLPYMVITDNYLLAEDTKVEKLGAMSMVVDEDMDAKETTRSGAMLTAALKMIVSTPKETYEQGPATELISTWSEVDRSYALKQLLEDKVFLRERTAASTGRFFTYAANWHTISEGPFPPAIYDEAIDAAVLIDSAMDEYKEWPLMGTSGGIAELLTAVSDHQVDFEIDSPSFPALIYKRHSHNTRMMNDDVFEGKISIKREVESTVTPTQLPDVFSLPPPPTWPDSPWMATPALADRVVQVAKESGEEGVSKPELLTALACVPSDLDAALAELSAHHNAEVFWAGYDTSRLVHVSFASRWMVLTRPRDSSDAPRYTRPRRWVDIYGQVDEADWGRVVRCVAGTVQVKPGLTERDLRSKLGIQLDRMEFNEVARDLLDRGVLKRDWIDPAMAAEQVLSPLECTAVEEEGAVGWWFVPGMGLA